MKYRLVAVDMDGTLLNDKKEITEYTAAAIRKAGEAGVSVCLSTGRPLCGVRRYLNELSLNTPVITCNGAAVVDPEGEKLIYSRFLEPSAAREIWSRGVGYNVTMCVWVGDELYVSRFDEKTDDYKKLSGAEPQPAADFDALTQKGISKILWYDTAENIGIFRRELDQTLCEPVRYVTSDPRFLEFIDESVSKGTALEKLGQYLGVTREQIMAIGDGENDLPMLEYAGLGVAMANASEAVRSRCDYITASNISNGVAKAIELFCL